MAQGSDLCGAAEGTAEQLCDPLWCVRDSASFITSAATHVKVDQAAVQAVALHWKQSGLLNNRPPFDRKLHFVRGRHVAHRPALTAGPGVPPCPRRRLTRLTLR